MELGPPLQASHNSAEQTPKALVQRFIDETLAVALDELRTPDGRPAITIKRRSRQASLFIDFTTGALESDGTETRITYTWPGTNVQEAWKFSITVVFRILAVIADAIDRGLVVSRRDIYYSDPDCFGTQKVVDTIVDDLAYTIGVDRSALNVEAAAKGLVAGYYRLTTRHGELSDAQISDSLIPSRQEIDDIDISDANWVLIVEKEAVYRRLARSDYHTKAIAGKGVLITGKGYPDLSTRAFVRKIFEKRHQSNKGLHFYALVDSDPDGMAIVSTYKYGSVAHTSENGKLNVPCLWWLGLRTSDVVTGASGNDDEALMRLTARDRKKIIGMLSSNPVWAAEGPELAWRAELQQMLMLNLKAEIEILYDREEGLEGWIDRQMASCSLEQAN